MSLNHSDFDWMIKRLTQLRGQVPTTRAFTRETRLILEEIHRDPFDPDLDVQRLRRRCRLRDNNVSSRFRFAVGVTMRQYIETIRLEAARRLIEESDVSIFDIALAVGYKHPQTFHTAFRRRFRQTPASRRHQRSEGEPARRPAHLRRPGTTFMHRRQGLQPRKQLMTSIRD